MNQTASAEIDSARPPASRTRFVVLAWLCALAAWGYVQRNAISVAADHIQADFHLNEVQMGWVFSSFFWAYALAQIPAGWLNHVWGSRFSLALFMAVSSVATAAVGISTTIGLLVATRIVCGIVQAGFFPACANSISKWFPTSGRALPSGFLGAFMSVGGVIATALTGWLLLPISWEHVFVLYAIPGGVWAVWFYWRFRDRPEDDPSVSHAELTLIREDQHSEGVLAAGAVERRSDGARHANAAGPDDDGTSESGPLAASPEVPWASILSSPKTWCVCGQQFFRAAGYIFYATWFPKYLKEVHGVTTAESGVLASLPLVGVILGGILGGPFSDWLYRQWGSVIVSRKLPGAASQYLCGLLIAAAYFIDAPLPAVAVISVGSFVFAFGSCCAYTVTMDIAGSHVAAVFSTMNMAGNVGAAVCPIVVGAMVKWIGWPPVLFLFTAIYVAAGLCWTALDPRGTIPGTGHRQSGA